MIPVILATVVIAGLVLLVFLLLHSQHRLERLFHEEMSRNRQEAAHSLKGFNDSVVSRMDKMSDSNDTRLERIRQTVEEKLKTLQEDSGRQLERIRLTVDEKLHETLDRRLGESFLQMNERLESVHKGLGEMKSLASGVGDLTKILSNVKTLGTLGEIQLGRLLEQIMTPEQYDRNVVTKPSGSDRVEYAIKLQGKNDDGFVWLPLDAKFPVEYYHRLVDACDSGDPSAVEEARKELVGRIKEEAGDIREKYLDPPNTVSFAVMFFPFEGLYAEVLRTPGLWEMLQRQYQVVGMGPTTLSAFLNALQLGFKTLAVEKRASEVWELLGAVKTEFGKFWTILEATRRKLEQATSHIELASKKSKTIEKKLKDVQQLSPPTARKLLEPSGEEEEDGIPAPSLGPAAIPEELSS